MNAEGWQAGLFLGSAFIFLVNAAWLSWRAWRHWRYRRLSHCPHCDGEVRDNGRGYGALEYLDVCATCGDTSIKPDSRI